MILKKVIQQKEQINLTEVKINTIEKLIYDNHPLKSGCWAGLITSSTQAED